VGRVPHAELSEQLQRALARRQIVPQLRQIEGGLNDEADLSGMLRFAAPERLRLEHSQQQQNNHDQEYQTESAARSVTPTPAVWPSRNRSQKQNNQNY